MIPCPLVHLLNLSLCVSVVQYHYDNRCVCVGMIVMAIALALTNCCCLRGSHSVVVVAAPLVPYVYVCM